MNVTTAGNVRICGIGGTVVRAVRSRSKVILMSREAMREYIRCIHIETSWTMTLGRSALHVGMRRGIRRRPFRDGAVLNLERKTS